VKRFWGCSEPLERVRHLFFLEKKNERKKTKKRRKKIPLGFCPFFSLIFFLVGTTKNGGVQKKEVFERTPPPRAFYLFFGSFFVFRVIVKL